MILEEQVRQWVRDEYNKLKKADQELCSHAEAGTLQEDGTIRCNNCQKVLTYKAK